MVFILYKLYVLLPYTYPTPKLSPHRRRCISTFPPKNLLCMIYKHFELWGHWKCPHKSPFPCNHTHTHTHTHTCTHICCVLCFYVSVSWKHFPHLWMIGVQKMDDWFAWLCSRTSVLGKSEYVNSTVGIASWLEKNLKSPGVCSEQTFRPGQPPPLLQLIECLWKKNTCASWQFVKIYTNLQCWLRQCFSLFNRITRLDILQWS